MLSHNWSIWICFLILALVWCIGKYTSLIATPVDDGILGGFIAILFTEGVRSALRSFREWREDSNDSVA